MRSNNYSDVLIAVQEMLRVIYAFILREIKTRFGKQRLGYIWALLEPILFVVVLVMVFSFRGKLAPQGMGLELFLITGIVPFFMFRHIMQASVRALSQNRNLLTYPQVQINDIIMARFLLECATSTVVFCLLVVGVHLLKIDDVIIMSPLGIMEGFFMMAILGLGLGLCLSALYPILPSIQPISEVLLGRPLFFTSGVFYTAEMLPHSVRKYLLWNPLFHVIEFIRENFFISFESSYYNSGYTLKFMFILLFMGMLMQRALHRYSLSLI